MKKFSITTKTIYIDKDNAEKIKWNRVGTLIHFDPTEKNPEGGYKIELNMFPSTDFVVFEDKPDKKENLPTVSMEEMKDEVNSQEDKKSDEPNPNYEFNKNEPTKDDIAF